MKPRKQLIEGLPPFDLIEEAFHLLRVAPASTLATYYVGTLPFVIGLLYFWSDMTHSAFAAERLGPASLGVTLLFCWMKVWQSIFARKLIAARGGEKDRNASHVQRVGGVGELCRLVCVQSLVHATGLFLWPAALFLLLPFGWVNAFYQNATALGVEQGTLKGTLREAARQSHLWVYQNHAVLLAFKAFWIFVFLNWMTASFAAPFLVKTLLGIETPFTQSPLAMLNSTFFAAGAILTYVSTDPLHKAIYVLRCFYGQSLQTARDLKADLRQFSIAGEGRRPAIAAALMIFLAGISPLGAATETPDSSGSNTGIAPRQPVSGPDKSGVPSSIAPSELDESISRVLKQREYSWRLPRAEKDEHRDTSLLEGFLLSLGETLIGWVKAAAKWIGDIISRIIAYLRPTAPSGSLGLNWIPAVRGLTLLLLLALIFFLAVILYRLWKRRGPLVEDLQMAQALPSRPDITDENVAADQMPEDEWIGLGRELLQRGELRLALRAFYLGSLALLATRNLITLARFKSNLDYERELRRRAHALPGLSHLFQENVSVFERTWYGLHDVTADAVQRFTANIEQMKAG